MPSETNNFFGLGQAYKVLPSVLFSDQLPTPVADPKLLFWNYSLANELNLQVSDSDTGFITSVLAGSEIPAGITPIAQAYAGHQFGHFTKLGDGRAILLGNLENVEGKKYDLQLKGPGPTPYSRNGDGRATLRAMLREYLMGEAMHHLGIATSRGLALVLSGEKVYREQVHQGSVLTRVMQSHIRVGTFEFARNFSDTQTLKALADYTIERYYPDLVGIENNYLAFFKQVQSQQIKLVVQWMRVGFIHGVMNTDNTSITAETFDYGPCAFINAYNLEAKFSSIDHAGRYCYGNQPGILRWNLSMLANALLPLFHEDLNKSVSLAQAVLETFQEEYFTTWYAMMYRKLGFVAPTEQDKILVNQLLTWLEHNKADYTNTFYALQFLGNIPNSPLELESFQPFLSSWKTRVFTQEGGIEAAKQLMAVENPAIIPRNHKVEEALTAAEEGDFTLFKLLLQLVEKPYEKPICDHTFLTAPANHDTTFQTYCGT
jgi:serine/tyrosine/threonine adenylyltransferase